MENPRSRAAASSHFTRNPQWHQVFHLLGLIHSLCGFSRLEWGFLLWVFCYRPLKTSQHTQQESHVCQLACKPGAPQQTS